MNVSFRIIMEFGEELKTVAIISLSNILKIFSNLKHCSGMHTKRQWPMVKMYLIFSVRI